jgi:pseudouridine-5'-phosphate glycosidase
LPTLADLRKVECQGIGGVHRGAETSFDISADLQELAAAGIWLAKAGFGAFPTPHDYAPLMLAAISLTLP